VNDLAFGICALRDRAERRRVEKQIHASLEEKEVLLKEIHHCVKNNLQIVSSLLNLQARVLKDEQVSTIGQESRNRIESMALIHDKLYRSKDLARIDFKDYIYDLTSNLLLSYGVDSSRIRRNLNVAEVALDVDTAIPVGMILNELVSNSLKHAFPAGRGGEIRIDLGAKVNGRYTLIVADDGEGFPEDLDFRNSESLGLKLVSGLVEQLDGAIELDNSRGTEFKISFGESLQESEGVGK
jgi:two-component sensor histidine kinase